MAEIACNVYDIFQPTPVSLKQISAIAINMEIWRSQVIKFRTSGKLKDFDLFLPDLPSTIRDIIYEFKTRFSVSMDHWKRSHYERIFRFHRRSPNTVLKDFDDFVVDFDGSIHYVRTAERMMRSDKLSEAEKFKIACTYFFEDDIRRIWPSVCGSSDLKDFGFEKSPQVYYWIGCLTNHSMKLRTPNPKLHSVDDGRMFNNCMPYNRPSVEYFWARLPVNVQLREASGLYRRDVISFVRFILPKLDDQRLSEFVNTEARELMILLWKSDFAYEWLWIPTWMYIVKKMNQNTLKNVVRGMLKFEGGGFADHSKSEPKNWLDFCSAVWNSIPSDLKRSMVEDGYNTIFSNFGFSEVSGIYKRNLLFMRFVTFFLIVLPSVSSERKINFWHDNWPHLIERTRGEDLRQMIKLCLNNEEEIAQFIDKNMANSDHVRDVCVELLKNAHFNQLNGLIDFCYPEAQKRMDFKQQLLRTTLYLEVRSSFKVAFFRILKEDFSGFKKLSTFIDSAFESVDLSAAFKNELMFSRVIRKDLHCGVPCHWSSAEIDTFIEFVESFATMKRNLKVIKNNVKRQLEDGLCCVTDSVKRVLLWCLGSEQEVAEFIECYLPY